MRDALRIGSMALLVLGVTAGWSFGQDIIKPTIRFAVDGSAPWTDDASWDSGTAPGEGDVASVQNGGTATVSSTAATVDAISINNSVVDVGTGGGLSAVGEVVIRGDDGSLNLTGDATLGAASLFSSGGLSLGGTSAVNLSGGFSSSGSLALDGGMISAGGPATLGGTIDVSSAPTVGSSIPFLTAPSLKGQPSSITVGGTVPSYERGLGLQVEYTGGTAAVAVGSVPIAVVNRATGNVTIENAAGGTLDVKGYEILSGKGLLSPDNWNSLTDQSVGGWSEIPSSNELELTELNFSTSTQLAVGDSVDLGSPWSTTVKPRDEDFAFNVLLADGRTLPGTVEYDGPANDLVLNVDPTTGSATLQHLSASVGDLELVGYSILSGSGSLIVDGFTGTIGEGFTKPSPQAVALAEVSLESSKVVGNGTKIDLGNLFDPAGTQDLVLQYGVAGSLSLQLGTVEYGTPNGDCDPNTMGDLDGNGKVEFADFLILSGNFGQTIDPADHTKGDIDCNTKVEFADFLVLSGNFGTEVGGAASVPEPSTGFMLLLGILGMLKFRKRAVSVAAVAVATGLLITATPSESFAQINTRFIRVHPEGGDINNTSEFRSLVNGEVTDMINNEDISNNETDVVDFGGGAGSFTTGQLPYLNGVGEGGVTTMDDFGQYISGTWEIPAGDWTVGFGRDDGGWLRFTDIKFLTTFNENGPTIDGDGEILWEGTGGHQWTGGTFTVPEGGITTGLEAAFFERGGGDSWEVAYVEGHYDADVDGDRNAYFAENGLELGPSDDWTLVGDFVDTDPNDLNSDGVVDEADFTVMSDNWGNFDFDDFYSLATAAAGPPAPAANSVPEPASNLLILTALAVLVNVRRRRR